MELRDIKPIRAQPYTENHKLFLDVWYECLLHSSNQKAQIHIPKLDITINKIFIGIDHTQIINLENYCCELVKQNDMVFEIITDKDKMIEVSL